MRSVAAGEAWVLWGALFLRLALRGGELLWLTNLPFLRWSKVPGEQASGRRPAPPDSGGGWKA